MEETTVNSNANNPETKRGITKLLLSRKVPEALITILEFFAYCFAYWMPMRLTVASVASSIVASESVIAVFGNELVAFLLAGLIPFIVTEMLANITLRSMFMFKLDLTTMRYLFRVFYGLGLTISGAVSLICFWLPFTVLLYSVVIRFVILTAFMVLYLVFTLKHCVPPHIWGRAMFTIARVYLLINLILAVIEIVGWVMQL